MRSSLTPYTARPPPFLRAPSRVVHSDGGPQHSSDHHGVGGKRSPVSWYAHSIMLIFAAFEFYVAVHYKQQKYLGAIFQFLRAFDRDFVMSVRSPKRKKNQNEKKRGVVAC